jgi:RecB family exonuclease
MTTAYRGSEVSDFLRCRKKWAWRWIDGYRPKKQNGKLFFGQLFHKFAEELYRTGQSDLAHKAMMELYEETDTSKMEQVELDEIISMAIMVTGNYIHKWWGNDSEWEILEVEYEFTITLDENIEYTGTIDLIFRNKRTGKVWFMDHKTTTSLDLYESNARMDRQISRYWWALKKLGYDVAGFIYNIILKDFPVEPKVLKSGKLSTAKNQNTTYEIYLETIKVMGQLPEEYMDYLEYLENNPREYFRRVVVTRNEQELASAMYEFYYQALEAESVKKQYVERDSLPAGATRVYRNITRDCSWDCPFKDVCKAELDGSNIEYLLNIGFDKEEN